MAYVCVVIEIDLFTTLFIISYFWKPLNLLLGSPRFAATLTAGSLQLS
jgi:hypothetical protein